MLTEANTAHARPITQQLRRVSIWRRRPKDADWRALYKVLLAHLAARGFHTVIGIVTTPNPASVRLHNACGFEPVGTLREVGRKFDNWHGTAIYQRMIGNDETAA
jgi:L-amino acid N-acyltransferase YncA